MAGAADSIIARSLPPFEFFNTLSQEETFGPAASAHRFLGRSPLSSPARRIVMERRLAAIMAADVVGYARLIRADEEGTNTALKALRAELIDPKIAAPVR